MAGPSTNDSRFAFWEAGCANGLTSNFGTRSLPRREPRRRNVVTVQFTAAVTHEDGWYVARALEVEVTS